MEQKQPWYKDGSFVIRLGILLSLTAMTCTEMFLSAAYPDYKPRLEIMTVLAMLAGLYGSSALGGGGNGKKLLGGVLVAGALGLGLTGCGTMEQTKAEGIRAAKCLANCAIQCGVSGAMGASQCQEWSEDALKAQGIKAAQCLTACSLGCGLQATEAIQWNKDQQTIAFGRQTNRYKSVGTLHLRAGKGGLCTAFLISHQHAMTAAHCAERFPWKLEFGSTAVSIKRWEINPLYLISPKYDLAVLYLSEPVPLPVIRWRGFGPWTGEKITIVGAGMVAAGKYRSIGVIRDGTAKVTRVDSLAYEFQGANNICPGDSGGPSLAGGEVVGLHAAVRGKCGIGAGLDVRLDANAGWVEAVTGLAL